MRYIWQEEGWPSFRFDEKKISSAYLDYQKTKEEMENVYSLFSERAKKLMKAEGIIDETLSSSSIEGESLHYDSVYSSVLKALSIDDSRHIKDNYAESVSLMNVEASKLERAPREADILKWHHLLFDHAPLRRRPRIVGDYRREEIYVIHSNGRGEEELIYEAVPHERVKEEMDNLFLYICEDNERRAIIKSAVASLWFVSIHPFQDGNGRISRALAEAVMSQMGEKKEGSFSMSTAILRDKTQYYQMLESVQKDSALDITQYLVWYINKAVEEMRRFEKECKKKIRTSQVIMHSLDPSFFNSRQLCMLYRLVDGTFYGKLNQEKWMKLTKCPSATATRDLSDLVEKKVLLRLGEGKGASYLLNPCFMDSYCSRNEEDTDS